MTLITIWLDNMKCTLPLLHTKTNAIINIEYLNETNEVNTQICFRDSTIDSLILPLCNK